MERDLRRAARGQTPAVAGARGLDCGALGGPTGPPVRRKKASDGKTFDEECFRRWPPIDPKLWQMLRRCSRRMLVSCSQGFGATGRDLPDNAPAQSTRSASARPKRALDAVRHRPKKIVNFDWAAAGPKTNVPPVATASGTLDGSCRSSSSHALEIPLALGVALRARLATTADHGRDDRPLSIRSWSTSRGQYVFAFRSAGSRCGWSEAWPQPAPLRARAVMLAVAVRWRDDAALQHLLPRERPRHGDGARKGHQKVTAQHGCATP